MALKAQNSTSEKDGNTKGRLFLITLNNHTEVDINLIQDKFERYHFQEETSSTGTQHLQGIVGWYSPRSFSTVKNILPRAHIEKVRSVKHAMEYCHKERTRSGGRWSNMVRTLKDPLSKLKLYKWQQDIKDLIKTEPNERDIYWYCSCFRY